ncbi:quercetin 2,3-dioxygenase [Streptomyces sp. NPDC001663]|uniref:quercetin 2,3-dioxygenase n=1 Tax=Streptomyces sp. NPDC001663 TaxID=3364597 RepID=UPI0036A9236B
MHDNTLRPGYVSLDGIGNGAPYILRAGEGDHITVRNGLRSLLTRAQDTEGNMGMTYCAGDTSGPTPPHFHHHTTEAVYVLSGALHVWQDDQQGTRIESELKAGDFGLLPTGWMHSWAFGAPDTRFLAVYAPGGFEGTLHYLDPRTAPTAEQLQETEKLFDVVWRPDYPMFGTSPEPGA